MERCGKCKFKYPDGYLSPIIGDGTIGKAVCGICALKLTNKALGINRTEFQGEIAEELRQKAINFRNTS